MGQYFKIDYQGPAFVLFGTAHLVYLAITCAVIAFLLWGWKNPSESAKTRTRYFLIATILINESSWHVWNIANDNWNLGEHLPFHICAVSIWCTLYILIARSFRFYEVFYFVGVIGGIQVMLTPNAGDYGLPHFRALQTMISHATLVIALVYMTVIEGFRPTWKSVWKTMLALNLYLLFVTAVNLLVGGNYMYTLGKPSTASLLDLMSPWPWYILEAEVLALAMFSLLYLPFALSDSIKYRQS